MTPPLDVFAIAGCFVDHIRSTCADRVALVAYYGSYATGTASPSSDLDLYYIPDDGAELDLYRSFVVGEVAFEFWPVSWAFAGRIADGRHHWSEAPSIIANARLLYARSDADRARFAGLQTRLDELRQPAQRPAMVERAADGLRAAALARLALEAAHAAGDTAGLRAAALDMAAGALDCLAALNQTFFPKGWASDLRQLRALAPAGLPERVGTILKAPDSAEVGRAALALVADTRAILLREQASLAHPEPPAEVFAGFYAGVKEYINKVLSACARGDRAAAASAAIRLQRDVAQMLARVAGGASPWEGATYGEHAPAFAASGFPDMIAALADGDLARLAERARRFDEHARGYFAQHAIPLNKLPSPAELPAYIAGGR